MPEPTTRGRQTIARHWSEYAEKVLPVHAPPVQTQETKRAFYAGAKAMLAAIMTGLTPTPSARAGPPRPGTAGSGEAPYLSRLSDAAHAGLSAVGMARSAPAAEALLPRRSMVLQSVQDARQASPVARRPGRQLGHAEAARYRGLPRVFRPTGRGQCVNRPTVGKLVVPYVVDERNQPIDFKLMHAGHVRRCAKERLCGICGKAIAGYLAFIGPADGRRCFADPWMHPDCGRLAMQQCPFLGGRDWRDPDAREDPLTARYSHSMALFTAPNGRAHRDELGAWHFEALGLLAVA